VIVLLRVVQRAERAQLARAQRLVVEKHRSGNERPGKTAAAGLVCSGDQPHAERAVERK
jgi:hypothetical protein